MFFNMVAMVESDSFFLFLTLYGVLIWQCGHVC